MNRPIKFRVWDKKNSQFLQNDNNGVDKTIFDLWDWAEVMSTCLLFPMDDYVFQQYTGCNDAFGKEIYEDDIVEINNGDSIRIGYIKFMAGIFFVNYMDEADDELGYMLISNVKVIGNLMEHPELLN